jgi:hypothetical protein
MSLKRVSWFVGLGCALNTALTAASVSSGAPTFSKDVAPIFYKHCVSCHRAGTTAPMSLLTYKDARPWAASIREKVANRVMPPWNADPRYGKWQNDPHLTEQEIATVVNWAGQGGPEGNPKDVPPLPAIAEGWHIGKPDVVFQMEEAFTVPAKQELDMQYFILDPHFTEDRWIQAAEVFPGNRHVVHHATLFIMEPGVQEARPRNSQFPGVVTMPEWQFKPSNGTYKGTEIERRLGVVETRTHETFAEMGHGDPSSGWPLGTAKMIKAGSKLVLQIHYHPSGKEETDLSKVGFVFAKGVPEHQIYALGVVNMNFKIPAGDPNYEVKAEATFLKQVHVWSLQPHMHLRGKDMEYRLIYPDGKSEVILSVPRYDFNNKYTYNLAEAKVIPAGTRMLVTAHFDNSVNNKLNPDPTIDVSRGLQTTDEMMNGHVYMTIDDEIVPGYKGTASLTVPGQGQQ